jgi:hypothetical protein
VVYWVQRAKGQRLDRADWTDRSRAPHHTQGAADELEEQVLHLRRQLRKDSDLGAYGADAIQQALREQGLTDPPSVRTIHASCNDAERWTAAAGFADHHLRGDGIGCVMGTVVRPAAEVKDPGRRPERGPGRAGRERSRHRS